MRTKISKSEKRGEKRKEETSHPRNTSFLHQHRAQDRPLDEKPRERKMRERRRHEREEYKGLIGGWDDRERAPWAWNRTPARTSARLGSRRTIRIDILINERWWVRCASELLRPRARGRERRGGIGGRGCDGGGEHGEIRRLGGCIFDGVGRLTGSESLRSPTDLGSSSHRKRHSRGPPRFRPPSRPGSSPVVRQCWYAPE